MISKAHEMSKQDESKSVQELAHLPGARRRAELVRGASQAGSPRPEARQPGPARPSKYQSRRLRPEPGHRTTREIVAAEPEPRFRSLALAQFASDKKGASRGESGASKWRRLGNRLLLLVEIAAVVGLIALLISGAFQLRDLNQQTAEALTAPTPTAKARQLLPGGSTPPTPAPLPGLYEQFVRQATPIVVPTPGSEAPTRIVIPKIGVDAPIVPGDGWEELKKGVGHHIGSANPGMRGNMVLSGHNDVFGEVFRDLTELEEGDAVTVHTQDRAYTYIVRGRRIVEPTEVSVMGWTREPTVTLITCYPYRVDTHRLVVYAELAP